MTDTSPEIAELVRQKLMARSAEERFVMGVRMSRVSFTGQTWTHSRQFMHSSLQTLPAV